MVVSDNNYQVANLAILWPSRLSPIWLSTLLAKSLTTKMLFSILFGRHTIKPFEISAEMASIPHTNDVHYFLDAKK